jgi:transketolase
MRNAFIESLIKLAEKDKDICLLTGDLGFSVFETFAKRFPKRFFNCGVAEQNMMGTAAGLALSGKKPYVYSIVPFVTIRCLEQIKDDVAYQNLNVKIVGVGGGYDYGYLGATHHATEDIAMLRVLPNFKVFVPGDGIETEKLMTEDYKKKGPAYFRLSNVGGRVIHQKRDKIRIGEPFVFNKGKDGVLIANGSFLERAKDLVQQLKEEGYRFKLMSMPTLKPIKEEVLWREIGKEKIVFSLEEHSLIGGMGTALAEILTDREWKGTLKRIGSPDKFFPKVGKADYIRDKFNLTGEKVKKYILKIKKDLKK